MGGRGRPKLLSDFVYDGLVRAHPRLTHRQRLNWNYAYDALNVLKDQPCFGYYYDMKKDKAKVSLLAELGRLQDGDLIRQIGKEAAQIGEEGGRTVKEMEKLLRKYRLRLQECV